MDVLIVVGDQDGFHEDGEIVSSPLWLADILSDEGLIGTFVLQARRAEILAQRGRRDVIAALRRHEIGLHGRDVHPIVPEVVERLGWTDGVDALMAVEGAELALLGRVFDVTPVASSQHRNYAAPQLFGVARRLGLPYLFGPPAAPPGHSLSWYAGALNVPFNAPVPDFLGFFPAVFDDALPDDAAFAALLEGLRRHVERCLAAKLPLLIVFTCHPERLCYAGPLELWLYGNGVNHGANTVPPGAETRRSRAEVDRALVNFRTLVRYLRDANGLEPTTVGAVVRRYGAQAETIGRGELADLAKLALATRQIPIGATCSAGEALLGFALALRVLRDDGALPERVDRRDCLGPVAAPPLAVDLTDLGARELPAGPATRGTAGALADAVVRAVVETGHLPAEVALGGERLGLGNVFGVLAEAYALAHTGRLIESDAPGARQATALLPWPRYPEGAVALGECQRRCVDDPLARPGLSTDDAALHARLQTWTLKPAIRS